MYYLKLYTLAIMYGKYKMLAFSIILITALVTTFCSRKDSFTFFLKDSGEIAEKQFEQLIVSLRNKDKGALKLLFSERAIEESDTIEEDIDYLLNFFRGEVISWEQDGKPIVDTKYEHGKRTNEIKSFFYIDTDKQEYVAFMLYYDENTIEPRNVGIYSLRIIKAEDEETEFGYWQEMAIPGIYCPH